MVVLVTGASGLLGRAVSKTYLAAGAAVRLIGRSRERLQPIYDAYGSNAEFFAWDAEHEPFPRDALDGITTVFNLMGEPFGGRWTDARKASIVSSRVTSTEKLSEAIAGAQIRLVSASSFAAYPGRRGEAYSEDTPLGGADETFVQSTLRAWEAAALAAESGNARVTVIRFGLVCAPDGYPKKLVRLFRRVGGAILGDGEQIVPLVDIDDAVSLMRWAAEGRAGEGIVNCVAPELPRFRDVAEIIAAALHRPARLRIPEWLARPLLGGSADYYLKSYDIRAVRAFESGFAFRYVNAQAILARALASHTFA